MDFCCGYDTDNVQGTQQVLKRRAIGIYGNAGWPSSVNDENGMPTKWEQRYKLAAGKVDSTEHYENFQLKKPVADTNPLQRKASVTDAGKIVANPIESGVFFSPTSASTSSSTAHSLQDVNIYCAGPVAFKAMCGRVMDNSELFFILADGLGLGNKVVPPKHYYREQNPF